MSSFCIFVKPTNRRLETTFVSLLRLGPVWQGPSLTLSRHEAIGLRYETLIGWSDFYGGSPAPVSVARATDGERTGWIVWGGSQGLRAVPAGALQEAPGVGVETPASSAYDERPLLWLAEPSVLPPEVVERVTAVDVERSGGRDDGAGRGLARPPRPPLRS
jgi:hypothetical protein